MTNLVIFCSPALRRLHMKFEQHWPRGFRGGYLKLLSFFPYKCTRKQTWPHNKKVKRQCTTITLAALVDLQSSMIVQSSAPRHPWFWRRRLSKVFTIYRHCGHLGHRTMTILAIFCSPNLRRLHKKFEQNWLSVFRGRLKMLMDGRTDILTDGNLCGKILLNGHPHKRKF